MKTFFNILQKCAHSTTIRYPDEPLKINTTNTINNPNANYNFITVCYTYNIVCKIYNEYIKSGKPTAISKSSYAKIKVFYDIENNKNNHLFLNNCFKPCPYLVNPISSNARAIGINPLSMYCE